MSALENLIELFGKVSGTSTSTTPISGIPKVSASIEDVKYNDDMTEMTDPTTTKVALEKGKDYLKKLLDAKALNVVETHSPYGKVKQLELDLSKITTSLGTPPSQLSTPAKVTNLVNSLNANPSLINAHLRPKIAAARDLSKPVSKTTKTDLSSVKLEPMSGGANIVGEFQAIKNTLAIEKSTMELIGGGEWAPALAPEATQKARLFTEILSKLEEQLQSHGKTLEDGDKKALVGAIQSLSEHERNAFTQLSYLKKYVALAAQHKDGKGDATKELDTLDLKTYVEKYFKTLKKAEKKSAKLMGVFGSLIGDAAIILA